MTTTAEGITNGTATGFTSATGASAGADAPHGSPRATAGDAVPPSAAGSVAAANPVLRVPPASPAAAAAYFGASLAFHA
ncbi:hypothetical protein ACFWNJ_09975, partial [Streptomyces sp. NPDC058398]